MISVAISKTLSSLMVVDGFTDTIVVWSLKLSKNIVILVSEALFDEESLLVELFAVELLTAVSLFVSSLLKGETFFIPFSLLILRGGSSG